MLLAALQVGEESLGVVEIFQRSDAPRDARPGFLQFVEQMVGHASRYLERQQSDQQPQDASSFLTDFEQFMLQLQRGENTEEVATTAANDGRQLLGCDRLSVAIHKGAKTSIVAISGQDSVNARANLTRAMAQIAERVIELREPLTFSGRIDDLPPQIEKPLADFVQESGSRMVKLLPLIEPDPLISRREDEHRRKAPPRPRETRSSGSGGTRPAPTAGRSSRCGPGSTPPPACRRYRRCRSSPRRRRPRPGSPAAARSHGP